MLDFVSIILVNKAKLVLKRFHNDERGPEFIEQVLQVAVIALPILAILYIILCSFCETIINGFAKIGVKDIKLTGFCLFGKCK